MNTLDSTSTTPTTACSTCGRKVTGLPAKAWIERLWITLPDGGRMCVVCQRDTGRL